MANIVDQASALAPDGIGLAVELTQPPARLLADRDGVGGRVSHAAVSLLLGLTQSLLGLVVSDEQDRRRLLADPLDLGRDRAVGPLAGPQLRELALQLGHMLVHRIAVIALPGDRKARLLEALGAVGGVVDRVFEIAVGLPTRHLWLDSVNAAKGLRQTVTQIGQPGACGAPRRRLIKGSAGSIEVVHG